MLNVSFVIENIRIRKDEYKNMKKINDIADKYCLFHESSCNLDHADEYVKRKKSDNILSFSNHFL